MIPEYKLLIRYPSRQRPAQFIETLGIYCSMLDRPDLCEIIVTADADDTMMYRSSVKQAVKDCAPCKLPIQYGRGRGKIDAINRDIEKAGPWDIVLLASDDMIVQEKGYDTIIREQMARNYPDTDGALWFWDGRQTRINTIECVGRKRYDQFGYLYHPSYKSLWSDNESSEIGLRDGKLTYIDRCIIKNESPDWQGSQVRDSLYKRNNQWFRHDEQNYKRRKALNFPP